MHPVKFNTPNQTDVLTEQPPVVSKSIFQKIKSAVIGFFKALIDFVRSHTPWNRSKKVEKLQVNREQNVVDPRLIVELQLALDAKEQAKNEILRLNEALELGRASIREITIKLEQVQTRVQEASVEEVRATAATQEANSEAARAYTEAQGAKEAWELAKNENRKLITDLKQEQTKALEANTEAARANTEAQEAKKALDLVKNDFQQLEKALEQAQTNALEANTEAARENTEAQEAKKVLDLVKNDFQRLKKDLEQEQAKAQEANAEAMRANTETQEAKKALDQAKNDIQQLKKDLDQAQFRAEAARAPFANLVDNDKKNQKLMAKQEEADPQSSPILMQKNNSNKEVETLDFDDEIYNALMAKHAQSSPILMQKNNLNNEVESLDIDDNDEQYYKLMAQQQVINSNNGVVVKTEFKTDVETEVNDDKQPLPQEPKLSDETVEQFDNLTNQLQKSKSNLKPSQQRPNTNKPQRIEEELKDILGCRRKVLEGYWSDDEQTNLEELSQEKSHTSLEDLKKSGSNSPVSLQKPAEMIELERRRKDQEDSLAKKEKEAKEKKQKEEEEKARSGAKMYDDMSSKIPTLPDQNDKNTDQNFEQDFG